MNIFNFLKWGLPSDVNGFHLYSYISILSKTKCKQLNNKLDNAIQDFEELNHLNNIALLYQMYEN